MARRGDLKEKDDRTEPTRAEKAFMAASAAFALLLFGYLLYQAITSPTGLPPEVEVTGVETMESGEMHVQVRLTNRGGAGLLVAEVTVACGDDPPTLLFQHVPAEGAREGHAVCPPGTTLPEARITHYVLA